MFKSLLIFLVFAFFIAIFLFFHPFVSKERILGETPHPYRFNNSELVNLVNNYRSKQDLPLLVVTNSMCTFANFRLIQIQTSFSHNGFLPYIHQHNFQGYNGENLAKDFYFEQKVLDAWVASPDHKANLDNPHYFQTCVSSTNDLVVMEYASF